MDRISEWFGEKVYHERLKRMRAFWAGEERFVVSVNSQEAYYRQVFDDAKIIEQAPLNLQAQAALPGLNLPAFFPDFGTISTAKYWGGTPSFPSNSRNIYIDPVAQDVAEALAISPLAVDHPDMDAAHAVRLYKAVCERLETDSLWLRMPDFQGPLNTAGLVMNQENFFVQMYTDPALAHAFLERVTQHLIRYARYFHSEAKGKVCGFIWPYTFFPCDLGLSLTEDIMPLLSAELYREFGIPCLRLLSKEFGGLHIHCCGDWGRHAPMLAESGIALKAAEFHYPFTRIHELACLAETTVFIPYIVLEKQTEFSSVTDYYEHLLRHTDKKYRYWFAFTDTADEALAFARKHGF